MRIEDDIEWDDEDDDAEAIIVIMALTASCIVNEGAHSQEKTKAKEEKRRSSVYNFQAKNVHTCNLMADVGSIFQTELSFFTN